MKIKLDQDPIESLEQKIKDILMEVDQGNQMFSTFKKRTDNQLEQLKTENDLLKKANKRNANQQAAPVIHGSFQTLEQLFKLKLNHDSSIFVKSPSLTLRVELKFPEDMLDLCNILQHYWLSTCYNLHPDVNLFWSFHANRPLAIGYCTGCCGCVGSQFFDTLIKFLKNNCNDPTVAPVKFHATSCIECGATCQG